MTGNLVCVTVKGDFSDPIWAKVHIRHEETLKKESIIFVDLLAEHNRDSTSTILFKLMANKGRILMAEAPSYYPSFGPVLSALQTFDIENLPIKDILVR